MNIFILVTLSIDYRILLPSDNSIMSLPLITLGGLEILGIDVLIRIFLIKISLIWLTQDYRCI
jgi:hypothetical protein